MCADIHSQNGIAILAQACFSVKWETKLESTFCFPLVCVLTAMASTPMVIDTVFSEETQGPMPVDVPPAVAAESADSFKLRWRMMMSRHWEWAPRIWNWLLRWWWTPRTRPRSSSRRNMLWILQLLLRISRTLWSPWGRRWWSWTWGRLPVALRRWSPLPAQGCGFRYGPPLLRLLLQKRLWLWASA